jgi:beta-glucosidase/6-phospho-beta-glucosidase/beta-galactosidase
MRSGVMSAVAAGFALAATMASATVVQPFPEGFLWGTAISGFQSDMGLGAPNDPNTDWWVWVRDPANLGSGRVSGDLPEAGPGFWERAAVDARLARKGLRNNALRMGIEWSRVFPASTAGVDASGGFTPAVLAALDALADPAAVAHYRDTFAELRRRKLEPMVTLNHFSLPLWLHDPVEVRGAFAAVDPFAGAVPSGMLRGGWLDPAIVGEFAKLAAWAGWKFGDQVDLWCTINEPVVILVSGMVNAPGVGGFFPPGIFSFGALVQAMPQLVAAHARAYDALHATDVIDANGDGAATAAGAVHNMVAWAPRTPGNPVDEAGAAHADYLYNRLYPTAITSGAFDQNLDGDTTDPGEARPDLAGRSDFLGVNYYLRATVTGLPTSVTPLVPLFDFLPNFSYQTPRNPGAPPCPSVCTDFGWEVYPQGLAQSLAWADTLGVPLYVTENGLADAADTLRAQYLFDHLSALQQVIASGQADVRGYFQWSLTDNFEWSSGYYPRFGLFSYDPVTGKRRRRAGAKVYRAIARRNGITANLARRYGP